MNMEEFATVIGAQLVIKHNPLLGGYQAMFENSDTKDSSADCMLRGSWGGGKTPNEAVSNYAAEIRGKILVLDAWSDKRRSFPVPESLVGAKP